MATTASFSDTDLRAIQRTFLARTATPEEVRLVLRPKHRTWQMRRLALLVPLFLGFPMWSVGTQALTDAEPLAGLLVTDFWLACGIVLLAYVLVFFLLPRALMPRFELVLRAGSVNVTIVALGYEQRRHGGCCTVLRQRPWCTFAADAIPYDLIRRWWQLPLPLNAGVTAIERILEPASRALRASVQADGGQSTIMDSTRRMLLAQCFGEAIVTNQELVLLLPPAVIWAVIGGLVGSVASVAALAWEGFYNHFVCNPHVSNRCIPEQAGVPLWLSTMVVLVVTAIPCLLADPWLRRAFAILPRGQGLLRIQVGGRVRGEYPFTDERIFVADWRDHDFFASQLYVKTRAWSGSTPAEHHFDESTTAMYTLDMWATGDPLPLEGEQRTP